MRRVNLINQCPVRYAYSYADSSYSTTDSVEHIDVISQGIFGVRQPEEPYELHWCRDLVSAMRIQDIIVARYKDPMYEIEIQDQSLRRLNVDVGDVIAYSAEHLYDKLGSPLLNQLWRVISVMPDFEKAVITLRALQTSYYLSVATDLLTDSTTGVSSGDMETWTGGEYVAPDGWTATGIPGGTIESQVIITPSGGTATPMAVVRVNRTVDISSGSEYLEKYCSFYIQNPSDGMSTSATPSSSLRYYAPTHKHTLDIGVWNGLSWDWAYDQGWFAPDWIIATTDISDVPHPSSSINVIAEVTRESAITKQNTYATKLTCGSTAGNYSYLYQDIHAALGIAYWQGKTVTLGCWVYCAAASTAKLMIQDGVGDSSSNYHAGGSNWQWLTVTHTINGAATAVRLVLFITYNASVHVAYFDKTVVVEGTYIDPSMYTVTGIVRDTTKY
jgi:hypothetical protein